MDRYGAYILYYLCIYIAFTFFFFFDGERKERNEGLGLLLEKQGRYSCFFLPPPFFFDGSGGGAEEVVGLVVLSEGVNAHSDLTTWPFVSLSL